MFPLDKKVFKNHGGIIKKWILPTQIGQLKIGQGGKEEFQVHLLLSASLTRVRSLSYSFVGAWVLLRTSSLILELVLERNVQQPSVASHLKGCVLFSDFLSTSPIKQTIICVITASLCLKNQLFQQNLAIFETCQFMAHYNSSPKE